MDWTLPIIILIVVAIAAFFAGRRGGSVSTGKLDQILNTQAELKGRVEQSESSLNERLEALSKRVGEGLNQHTEKTGEQLKGLHERLAIIDTAQKNIAELGKEMVGLQDILSNKQARGAFGEIQLGDLVKDILPPSAYVFQATLSNGKRADCLLTLPNPPGAIAIDSKFPLESYQKLQTAEGETEKIQAGREFSAAIRKHIFDIAERYIIPGETAESALMFLPSEAVYSELHANFRNVVEESFKRRVWIVSPTTLMATLNTVRAILKDARMREQAGVIQSEVFKLLEDVARMDKRVDNLQTHFNQASRDIEAIRTSSGKVTKRGEKIDALQFEDDSPVEDLESPRPQLKEV